jgi:hypothetical protein
MNYKYLEIKLAIENERKCTEKIRLRSNRNSSFNKEFLKLRDSLELENVSRKCQFDSLLKKVKAKFFKTIFETFRKCFIDQNLIQRLPQSFITNIKIDYNKENLKKPLIEIYNKHGMLIGFENLREKKILKQDKIEDFLFFVSKSLSEVFEIYLNSNQFKRDCEKMNEKEGSKLVILFEFIARNIVKYYTNSKGNKRKKNRRKSNSIKNFKNIFMVYNKNE